MLPSRGQRLPYSLTCQNVDSYAKVSSVIWLRWWDNCAIKAISSESVEMVKLIAIIFSDLDEGMELFILVPMCGGRIYSSNGLCAQTNMAARKPH